MKVSTNPLSSNPFITTITAIGFAYYAIQFLANLMGLFSNMNRPVIGSITVALIMLLPVALYYVAARTTLVGGGRVYHYLASLIIVTLMLLAIGQLSRLILASPLITLSPQSSYLVAGIITLIIEFVFLKKLTSK